MPEKTVRDQHEAWGGLLDPQVLDLPTDSYVGLKVSTYLRAVDLVLALTQESDLRDDIELAARTQCDVWLFG